MALDVQPITGMPAKAAARLCNFVTGRSDLLNGHIQFLDSQVQPIIQTLPGAWVDLFGFASRLGNANSNQTLSENRIGSVRNRIAGYAPAINFQQYKGLGEAESGPDESDDSGYWRAVEVYVYAYKPPPPRPRPKRPKTPKLNTKLKLKMHANLNASVIAAADFSIFQIWDEAAGLCSYYTYWAGGVSGGLIPGAWLSATLPGDWNEFSVSKPMAVNKFAGPTRFSTAGGGPWSKNYVNFMGLPPGTQTIPNPLPIETGFTVGIGAGSSVGTLQLELLGTRDGLLPFKGP